MTTTSITKKSDSPKIDTYDGKVRIEEGKNKQIINDGEYDRILIGFSSGGF